jgi:predicted metal-dependent phosphoesterase TrpH
LNAVAITLHDKQRDLRDVEAYARGLGVTLIPGVERTIDGRHVLLLNFPAVAERVDSFEAVARLKAAHPEGLVVAPHPFFPHPSCLRSLMDRHADLFDAVEINAFYTAAIDFNAPAKRWAAARGKPLVANSDAHRLTLVGRSCSVVDAEPDAGSICAAIRAGRVSVQTQPLSLLEAGSYITRLLGAQLWLSLGTRPARPRPGDNLART